VTTALAFVLGLTALAPQSAQPPPSPSTPVVVATGEGVVKRAPDRAWVTVTAESRAKTPQEAQKLNAAAMSSVLQKLKGAGISEDAIQTAAYDLQPEYDYNNGRQTLRGYVARNSLDVRVDALPKLGEIIDLAVGSGATMVSGVRFDLKDRKAVEREALRMAVADARGRAEALAAGADMKVAGIVRIEEQGAAVMPPPRPVMAMRAEMAQQQTTPVAPGELEIRAAVTLTAALR
jgi:uncharacterized protein YggE